MRRSALVFVIFVFLLPACGESPDAAARKAAPWKFAKGQIVESVLDGRRGQIVEGYRYPHGESRADWYDVRFSGVRTHTNVSLLGADGPLESAPFSIVRMEDFELREAE